MPTKVFKLSKISHQRWKNWYRQKYKDDTTQCCRRSPKWVMQTQSAHWPWHCLTKGPPRRQTWRQRSPAPPAAVWLKTWRLWMMNHQRNSGYQSRPWNKHCIKPFFTSLLLPPQIQVTKQRMTDEIHGDKTGHESRHLTVLSHSNVVYLLVLFVTNTE